MFKLLGAASAGLVLVLAFGCNERSSDWEAPLDSPSPIALSGSVVLGDSALNRILFLSSPESGKLDVDELSTGIGVEAMTASADGERLFVLSSGEFPRTEESDEPPQLMVFDGAAGVGADERLLRTFELDDPMVALRLDPLGDWVAAYQGAAGVINPNQLVLFSLEGEGDRPETKTIRSFGGAPEDLVFTDELEVPVGGARRFLVVRTDRDITLVDLLDLDKSEVTVKLPENEDGVAYSPTQVVFDDGDPERNDDARIAVRLEGTSDVFIMELGDPGDSGNDFTIVPNIVDVGGEPSSIDFVRTDGGLRLAALVPGTARAVLVNPETTDEAEVVELPHAFSNMTRITEVVSDTPGGGDVALLWGAAEHIGFWSLGETSATPYRSIETTELSFAVTKVLDVPPPHENLKVLTGASSDVFVLDLDEEQSFPLLTNYSAPALSVSADGERLWIFAKDSPNFSAVTLEDLSPRQLYVEPGVSFIGDIERGDGGRSAILLDLSDGWAATLMDADSPNSAETAYFPALQLEGLE